MTAVYLLRHPETTWNVERRYQGRLDAPVSPRGRMQSRLAARSFAGAGLDAVYSSPMIRALHLAREIAEAADAPLVVDDRLTEIAMGPWEGLYVDEIQERFPDLHREWYEHPETVTFPSGESVRDVQRRSLSVLDEIFRHRPQCQVAVVTHSVVVQVLTAAALSLDLHAIHRIHVGNASTTTICGDSVPGSLLALNVTESLYRSPVASAAEEDCVSWKDRRRAS